MIAHGPLRNRGGQGHVNSNVLNSYWGMKISIHKKYESVQDSKDTSILKPMEYKLLKDNDLTTEQERVSKDSKIMDI